MSVSFVNSSRDGWYFTLVSLLSAVSMYRGQFANLTSGPGVAPKSTPPPAVVSVPPLLAVEPPPQAARIDAMLSVPTLIPAYLIMLRRDIRRWVMPRSSAERISGDTPGV